MRFFTFFTVASAIAICSNAVSINKREYDGTPITCDSALKSANDYLVLNYESFGDIDWSKYKKNIELLADAGSLQDTQGYIDEPSQYCCKTLGLGLTPEVADSTFNLLSAQADSYVKILTYVQQKKGEVEKEKDKASMVDIKKYLDLLHSTYTKLFDCMYPNTNGALQPKLNEWKAKISKVDTEVRKTYGL